MYFLKKPILFILTVTGHLVLSICLADEAEQPGSNDNDTIKYNTISKYEDVITRMEIESGPYNQRLTQPLLSLGIALLQRGDYSAATENLNRSLYIERVNKGLHNLSQAPILDIIIQGNIAQKDWKAVNHNFIYLEWLYRRNYNSTDPVMLPVIDRLSTWHLAAANLDIGDHPGFHFIKLLDLDETAVKIVENESPENKLVLAQRLYKLALTHYYIAIAVQRGEHLGVDLVEELMPFESRQSYDLASDKIVKKSYFTSRKLIKRITSMFADDGDVQTNSEAIALIYLADWDLIFNRRIDAKSIYHQAYDKLIAGGLTAEQLDNYFKQPKILPRTSFSLQMVLPEISVTDLAVQSKLPELKNDKRELQNKTAYIIGWSTALPGLKFPADDVKDFISPSNDSHALVSFDVLDTGLTENIQVLQQFPEQGRVRIRARNAIWTAQFRPRLKHGRAVQTSGVVLRYYLPD